MPDYNWRPFLEEFSSELLADNLIRRELPTDVTESGWLGYDPATQEQVEQLEQRLGVKLPDSYRQFLLTSNGWRFSGMFIYDVFSAEKVEWFRENNQDWIDAYVEPAQGEEPVSLEDHCDYSEAQDSCMFRVEYLQNTLQISGVGDAAVYLLNPEIKTSDGEWEAWFFATWAPGASRYPSFWDMMQNELESAAELGEEGE